MTLRPAQVPHRNFDEAELLEIHSRHHRTASRRVAQAYRPLRRLLAATRQYRSISGKSRSRPCATTWRASVNVDAANNGSPPMTGPEWHYRRRARLAVKDVHGKGRALVGFRERHAPFIADMHRCEVLAYSRSTALISDLSDLVGGLSIRARLPQIEVAVAENAIALVFRVLDPPTEADVSGVPCQFGKQHKLAHLPANRRPRYG